MKKKIHFNPVLGRLYKDNFFTEIKPANQYITLENGFYHGKLDLSKVVGVVNSVTREGDALVGEVCLLDTPMSKYIDLEQYDLCPAGFGTVKDNVVQDDYKLLGFELVLKQ